MCRNRFCNPSVFGSHGKNEPRTTGLEPTDLADPRSTGQPPNRLRQRRPAEFSYFKLPLLGVPDPMYMCNLWILLNLICTERCVD